ncbi:uncharacterized protein LOC110698839 [Chenopodium quinoa]|uniref:uncharacterized protein LOC110698839 n=1 Tax=Chenopodium quinoa TaxID=63459 RepID=UPI000B7911D8|nr:uncharacterized protein LOC110698839 [Chenopodium quinoa]
MSVDLLRESCIWGKLDLHVPDSWNIWYKQKGKTWSNGKKEILSEDDVKGFLETKTKNGFVVVYCTSQVPSIVQPTQNRKTKADKPTELRKSPRFKLNVENTDKVVDQTEEGGPYETVTGKKSSRKRLFSESVKGKKKQGEQEGNSGRNTVKGKGKCTTKGRRKKKTGREVELETEAGSGSSSSDCYDTDPDWDIGEEKGLDEDAELEENVNNTIQNIIQEREFSSDSEELDSPKCSDDEEDKYPWFHASTDFKKPIVLVKGQKFINSKLLRRALRVHAVENRYEYWYLHNDSSKLTIHCRRRCQCKWNVKKCRLPKCTCVGGRRCHFKVVARRSVNQDFWQIKNVNLKHRCVRVKRNLNLTAEFLAEKYIEDWRSDPGWKLKGFIRRVLTDLGIEITYSKAWMSRARAKLMIYGSAAQQYARVWDYGKALMKYNPGTQCNVVIDGIEKPEPPLFLRMFVCLAPLAKGFLSGCRPLIGVDGCHLKGPYPGQILVAVGKDGNNNIYPIAWATCEIENTETWVWFLESLMKSLKDENEGLGFTFMSDRQKGLLEAFQQVVPNADTRYCVRHIWANFKLQFSGATFKELFWAEARATTQFDFEVAIESIRFLSEDALEYLADILVEHWSRHAFSSFPKSNMLLNNVCETFNAVIKEARDKPILTQMEWLRRYMMKRNNDKWESYEKMEGKVVPYVRKAFQRIEPVARHCIVQVSRGDTYEVELNSDIVKVDLSKGTFTCYHWELTGIPCVHAYACIMDKRADPEEYVDSAYFVSTYMLAYRYEVAPMPGPNHWEKVKLREPLPPAIKVQPGRPKSKKRKLEQGEIVGQSQQEEKPVKRRATCKNCGQL